MFGDGNKDFENFSRWMNKLLPVDTQVIDADGNEYSVAGWYILRDQIYVKLVQGAGKKMTVYNVLIDEMIHWARFPPRDVFVVNSAPAKNTSTIVRKIQLLGSFNKTIIEIVKSARFINSRSAKIFTPKPAQFSDDNFSDKYRCVSIRYKVNTACELVQKFETQPYLSNKPPLFLETKRRFLSSEGISLPLHGCTAISCQCRFIHHKDRRGQNRRNQQDDLMTPISASTNRERRDGIDRRRSSG
ncbi:MAG: hypothetical protein LM513_02730 [Nitrospira sp.]|nr:hypothetical protein [Nitrospira sp.]